jgi:hypothetical protein
LKRVGRGAGLERAAAEDRRAAVADVAGDLVQHLLVLDRARSGDAYRMLSADLHLRDAAATDLDDAVFFMKLARGELVRLHDGDDFFDPVEALQMVEVEAGFLTHGPDDGAELALREVRGAPHAFNLAAHAVNAGLRRAWAHDDDHWT